MAKTPQAVRVAVAGGGMAGLAAAWRLAQRGYAVTLYEEKPWLGGNAGSHQDPDSSVYHDVYPHMFSNFYVNFWDICENDLGLKRSRGADTDFEAREGFKFLTTDGSYREMRNASNPLALWRDLRSGVAQMAPLDIWLYLYSMVDLLAHRFTWRGHLGDSVNGFLRGRPTVTQPVAEMHDAIVMLIWSIHADATSAGSYQNFYRHTFGNVDPLLWLLRGSLQEKVIGPLERKLLAQGCTIHKNTSVQRLAIKGGRAVALELQQSEFDWQRHAVRRTGRRWQAEPFDHLVLALPPHALGKLADNGAPGQTLASVMPQLAHAGERLPSEPIAVMDVYFKIKLEGIPQENIATTDSDNYFSIVNLSELWPGPQKAGITALTIAASDYWALPSDDDEVNAFSLLRELNRYVKGFNPGKRWGDPDSDIDWARTHYHSNKDDVIFVNQVGSWDYRPDTVCPAVENLYFAGDFCRNHVDMATVEAAVSSGINAAAALQARAPMGEPIVLKQPPLVPAVMIGALKLWLAPSAYAAKAWLTGLDAARKLSDDGDVSDAVEGISTLARLPWDYVGDMIDTLGSMAESLVPGALEADGTPAETAAPAPAASPAPSPASTPAAAPSPGAG